MQTILSQIEIVYKADRRCRRIALEISYGLIQTIYQRMEAKAGTVTYILDRRTRVYSLYSAAIARDPGDIFWRARVENILVPPP